jgi:hypothetical protein
MRDADSRERGLRNAGLLTAALAAVGVVGTFGVIAAARSADAPTATSTSTSPGQQSTSDSSTSGVWSGGRVWSGKGRAQAQSGGS